MKECRLVLGPCCVVEHGVGRWRVVLSMRQQNTCYSAVGSRNQLSCPTINLFNSFVSNSLISMSLVNWRREFVYLFRFLCHVFSFYNYFACIYLLAGRGCLNTCMWTAVRTRKTAHSCSVIELFFSGCIFFLRWNKRYSSWLGIFLLPCC